MTLALTCIRILKCNRAREVNLMDLSVTNCINLGEYDQNIITISTNCWNMLSLEITFQHDTKVSNHPRFPRTKNISLIRIRSDLYIFFSDRAGGHVLHQRRAHLLQPLLAVSKG